MLSVYDGDQITAANAFAHYTQTLKLESSGVMAVSVTECNELALPVRPDPAPFLEHALIDFSCYNRSTTEKKAKQLREKAAKRGWLCQETSA